MMSGVFSKRRGKKIVYHKTTAPWFLFRAGHQLIGTVEHIWRRGPKKHLFYDDGVYYSVRLLVPCEVARRTRDDDLHNRTVKPFMAKAGTLVNLQNGLATESLLAKCEKHNVFARYAEESQLPGSTRFPTIKLVVRGRVVHPTDHRVLWDANLFIWEDDETIAHPGDRHHAISKA